MYPGFLSTLSLRRATMQDIPTDLWQIISIHALLAESDRSNQTIISQADNFYPRSPCGERHRKHQKHLTLQVISIHALLAESDLTSVVSSAGTMDFYPRSPCGERQRAENHASSQQEFLSTLSLRRATSACWMAPSHQSFLSTLSLRRATFC